MLIQYLAKVLSDAIQTGTLDSLAGNLPEFHYRVSHLSSFEGKAVS